MAEQKPDNIQPGIMQPDGVQVPTENIEGQKPVDSYESPAAQRGPDGYVIMDRGTPSRRNQRGN